MTTRGLIRFLTTLLTPSQKRRLKKWIHPYQILKIKQFLDKGNEPGYIIQELRRKLFNLGFSERAYNELSTILSIETNIDLKRAAAWQLIMWHAEKATRQDADMVLNLLALVADNERDPDLIRRLSVMKAESLARIGKIDDAKGVIGEALQKGKHADLFLAAANLENELSRRLNWINQALKLYNLKPIHLIDPCDSDLLGSIRVLGRTEQVWCEPLVTVIVSVFNAEGVLDCAIQSILAQTWANMEIILVDDCSNDQSLTIIQNYAKQDKRVKWLRTERNSGPYVCRNLALQVAKGEFVTCHDADDWSHPMKIETQVWHLLNHPKMIGNLSQQVRVDSSLTFHRRGKEGAYISSNMSSFMFRRKPVLQSIGFWDSVRFGADSEFIRRIKKIFGDHSVAELTSGPLSFQRYAGNSLTGNNYFGYHGFFMGARKFYFDTYVAYHDHAESLRYEFPQKVRPFPIPEPMRPAREVKNGGRRHFDVVIVSDFRLDGGSTLSSVEEIKAQSRLGLRTGLIQLHRYDYDPAKHINPKIMELIDDHLVQMIVYGEKVSCDLLLVRYPPVLEERQRFVPDVIAKEVVVIANQSPMSDYSERGVRRYDLLRCHARIQEYFGKDAKWYPIGPLIRTALQTHHKADLKQISFAEEECWYNIIDVEEWKRDSRPTRKNKIVIGRHSRDQNVKWPSDRDTLLQIYPESAPYEIHILGGAETPRSLLGKLPKNWRVMDFGEVEPKEFLQDLDVFVYYTHPHWVESFGRVILEAMAVGVPVILPNHYRPLFGDAAIYAAPHEVKERINLLMNNNDFYESTVHTALHFVNTNFGYRIHERRLMNYISQGKIGGDHNEFH